MLLRMDGKDHSLGQDQERVTRHVEDALAQNCMSRGNVTEAPQRTANLVHGLSGPLVLR